MRQDGVTGLKVRALLTVLNMPGNNSDGIRPAAHPCFLLVFSSNRWKKSGLLQTKQVWITTVCADKKHSGVRLQFEQTGLWAEMDKALSGNYSIHPDLQENQNKTDYSRADNTL